MATCTARPLTAIFWLPMVKVIVVDHDEASGSEDDEDLPEQVFSRTSPASTWMRSRCPGFLATLDGRGFKKRRSWKENKKFKAEARKDRGSFVKGASGEAPRGQYGGVPGQKPPLLSAPWKDASRGVEEDHEVSPLPQEGPLVGGVPPRNVQSGGDGAAHVSGFCYLGNEIFYQSSSTTSFLTWDFDLLRYSLVTGVQTSSGTFVTIPSAMAIVDIGTTQDIIGATALRALEYELDKCGLKVVDVAPPTSAPSGIGGSAKVVRAILAPISPGGVPGAVHFIVVQENIPPLLSVGFLEHLGAAFDLVSNEINLRTIGVQMKMHLLPSGHRAIPLVEWDGSFFPVPPPARASHGLAEDAFMKKTGVKPSSQYAKSSGRSDRALRGSVSFASQPEEFEFPIAPVEQCVGEGDEMCSPSGDIVNHVSLCGVSGSAVASMGSKVSSTTPKFEASSRDHEDPSRPTEPTGAAAVQRRWRTLVTRVFFMLETVRLGYHRLAIAEPSRRASIRTGRATWSAPIRSPANACARESLFTGPTSTPRGRCAAGARLASATPRRTIGLLRRRELAHRPGLPDDSSKVRDGFDSIKPAATHDSYQDKRPTDGGDSGTPEPDSSSLGSEFSGSRRLHEGSGQRPESHAADVGSGLCLRGPDGITGGSQAPGPWSKREPWSRGPRCPWMETSTSRLLKAGLE